MPSHDHRQTHSQCRAGSAASSAGGVIARRSLLAAGLAGSGLLACPPARAQTTTLRLAQYKAGDQLLLRLAGLDAAPYRAEWAEFGSGNLMLEAVSTGSLDLAYGSEVPPSFAALSGARVRIVAVARGDVNEQVVLVPAGSFVQSVAELRGKRVGYVRATTTHYYLFRMLEEAGLSWSDIQPVNLTPADGQAAFRAGSLDAWAIYGYSVPMAKQAGARVLRTAAGILSGNYPYFASPDTLSDPVRRAAIVEHLRRLAQAFRWLDTHHAEYAAAQAPLIGVPAAAVRDLLDGASQPRRMALPDDAAVASHQAVADTFQRAGLLPRPVDVSPLWDRSLNLGAV